MNGLPQYAILSIAQQLEEQEGHVNVLRSWGYGKEPFTINKKSDIKSFFQKKKLIPRNLAEKLEYFTPGAFHLLLSLASQIAQISYPWGVEAIWSFTHNLPSFHPQEEEKYFSSHEVSDEDLEFAYLSASMFIARTTIPPTLMDYIPNKDELFFRTELCKEISNALDFEYLKRNKGDLKAITRKLIEKIYISLGHTKSEYLSINSEEYEEDILLLLEHITNSTGIQHDQELSIYWRHMSHILTKIVMQQDSYPPGNMWRNKSSEFKGLKSYLSKHPMVTMRFSLTRFPRPHNRFTKRYGSSQFFQISYKFPVPSISDLLSTKYTKTEEKKAQDSLKFSILNIVLSNAKINNSRLKDTAMHYERHARIELVDSFKFLLYRIKLGRWFHLVSCNITGALENKYTFSCVNIDKICEDSFVDRKQVVNKKKPMLAALRLGLLNTTVIPTLKEKDFKYDVCNDMERNGAVFTDGCGMISKTIAKNLFSEYKKKWFSKVQNSKNTISMPTSFDALDPGLEFVAEECPTDWLSFNLPPGAYFPKGYIPSAFQIRFRGFKGMLVVSDIIPDGEIQFLNSMNKFQTPADFDSELYVVGLSYPAPLVKLSSELILQFEAICAEQKKSEEIFSFLRMILIERREDCQDSLSALLKPSLLAAKTYCTRRKMDRIEYDNLYAYGIAGTSHLLSHILRLNTFIPDSAHVYGVADHSNSLREREIFIQVNGKIIMGTVFITKTPSLTTSDFCRYTATQCPTLTHIKDVVVFSVQGNKPAPSRMASADLDGDQFYVFWNKTLIDCLGNHDLEVLPQCTLHPEGKKKTLIMTPQAKDKETFSWSVHFDSVVQNLTAAVNSFEICRLSDLLYLRNVFNDQHRHNWGTNELCQQIAIWLTRTFEAPKHGNWVTWAEVKMFMQRNQISELPILPHYNPRAINAKNHSNSLYGRLFDEVMKVIGPDSCKNCACIPDLTLLSIAIRLRLKSIAHITPALIFSKEDSIQRNNDVEWFTSKRKSSATIFESGCPSCIIEQNLVETKLCGVQRAWQLVSQYELPDNSTCFPRFRFSRLERGWVWQLQILSYSNMNRQFFDLGLCLNCATLTAGSSPQEEMELFDLIYEYCCGMFASIKEIFELNSPNIDFELLQHFSYLLVDIISICKDEDNLYPLLEEMNNINPLSSFEFWLKLSSYRNDERKWRETFKQRDRISPRTTQIDSKIITLETSSKPLEDLMRKKSNEIREHYKLFPFVKSPRGSRTLYETVKTSKGKKKPRNKKKFITSQWILFLDCSRDSQVKVDVFEHAKNFRTPKLYQIRNANNPDILSNVANLFAVESDTLQTYTLYGIKILGDVFDAEVCKSFETKDKDLQVLLNKFVNALVEKF